jgi:Na+/H+-dicarboxylate symporter
MPLAMRTAKESLGVRPAIANLLITLGTVFNMGGTTIYQVSTMVFLAQAFGVHLSLATLLVMILILQTSSVGTPGIPGASMAILATALTTAGIPLKGLSLVLGVDRILDMARTSVNVIGDLSSTVMMDEMSRKRKPDPGN